MNFQTFLDSFSKDLPSKSVLIVGSGWMAEQYATALSKLKISDVSILGNGQEKVTNLCKRFGFLPIHGGFENEISKIPKKDLVIICTPISLLISATQHAINSGQDNVLVEKPGSVFKKELELIKNQISNQNIRVGYNRLVYPSLQKLKDLVEDDGGITSCSFTITEWVDKINFQKEIPLIYQRWGIANTSHVISMVVDLIGFPKNLHTIQQGSLEWHKTGSIFVGSGESEKRIPFSYHANWGSSGRWGIEVYTKKYAYRLVPLEELFRKPLNSTQWEKIKLNPIFPDIKTGIIEEIISMLDSSKNLCVLPDLTTSIQLNQFVETIFGYDE